MNSISSRTSFAQGPHGTTAFLASKFDIQLARISSTERPVLLWCVCFSGMPGDGNLAVRYGFASNSASRRDQAGWGFCPVHIYAFHWIDHTWLFAFWPISVSCSIRACWVFTWVSSCDMYAVTSGDSPVKFAFSMLKLYHKNGGYPR